MRLLRRTELAKTSPPTPFSTLKVRIDLPVASMSPARVHLQSPIVEMPPAVADIFSAVAVQQTARIDVSEPEVDELSIGSNQHSPWVIKHPSWTVKQMAEQSSFGQDLLHSAFAECAGSGDPRTTAALSISD